MGLFSKKDSADLNYVGVDIGGSSIKMVELTNNNGRAQLVTYGYLERSLKGGAKLIDEPDKTAELIKRVAEKCRLVSKRAVTALPGPAVFSSIISLSEISRKDLASPKKITAAVEWEAKKVLPLPLEEMILDWKVIGSEDILKAKSEGGDEKIKNLQVLLTGAAKEVVSKYIDIFKKAGLDLISLETESFSLARALVGKDRATVILVDIGAVNTDISVIENAIPLLSRSLGIGGLEITKEVANTLNVSLEQAEQFKRDLAQEESVETAEELPEIIKRPVRAIMDEVQYTMNFYLEQPDNKNKKIERIVLSGGTAQLFNLPKHFTNQLGIRTFIGNPWARVIYPEDLQPILDNIGSRFATAIGLAMRDIE
ncbi:type IV pilus assembly protein PilM [Candidatus Falkowbacteria bacterium]|nr:type IV pilus assembly protein PilM [Candidatus Falkowbacteria bacterium]